MKTIKCICPSCGAKLEVNEDKKTLTCPYCSETVLLDDETVHIKHDDMEQAGYEFEKGRQKAIEENSKKQNANVKVKEDKNESRNKILLGLIVILLAIMFFPLIVTFYLVKEKKFQPKVRYAIIAVCWIAWAPLAYMWIHNENTEDNVAENKGTAEPTVEAVEDTEAPSITFNEDIITIEMSDEFDPASNVVISDDTTKEFVQLDSKYSSKDKTKGWYVIDSKVNQSRPGYEYTVKITAGDSAGNETEAEYTVNVIYDGYEGEVVEDDLLNQAMVQLAQDDITSDRINEIGSQLGLNVYENYQNGALTNYVLRNPNVMSGSITCRMCRNNESNYEEFLASNTFTLDGIEDEKNLSISIVYKTSNQLSLSYYPNGVGYYINDQYYATFDEAYNAYLAMKN